MNLNDFPLELIHNGGTPFLRTAQKSPICLFMGQKTDWINLFCEAPQMLKIIEELVIMAEQKPLMCCIPKEILEAMKEIVEDIKEK